MTRDKAKTMMRSGKSLERLVASLERAFAGADARIEAPSRRLVDRDTGMAREFDVLIEWKRGHHQLLTAIECKNHGRPIGVSIVEAFADKCDTAGIHSGVIVSTSGFTVPALAKAKARALGCMQLDAVAGFDWLGIDAMTRFRRHFDHVDTQIMFVGAMPASIASVSDTDGNRYSTDEVVEIITNLVPPADDPETEVDKVTPVRVRLNTVNWTAFDGDGKGWPIDHILVRTSFTCIRTQHTLTAHRYSGGGKDYAVVTADASLGDREGTIMLIKDEDEQLFLNWSSAEKNSAR